MLTGDEKIMTYNYNMYKQYMNYSFHELEEEFNTIDEDDERYLPCLDALSMKYEAVHG